MLHCPAPFLLLLAPLPLPTLSYLNPAPQLRNLRGPEYQFAQLVTAWAATAMYSHVDGGAIIISLDRAVMLPRFPSRGSSGFCAGPKPNTIPARGSKPRLR